MSRMSEEKTMTVRDVLRKLSTCTSVEHGQWALDELGRICKDVKSLLADMREQIKMLESCRSGGVAGAVAEELEEWADRIAAIDTID